MYLVSALTEDESLDEVKPKRFILDDRMVSEPIRAEDSKDNLRLFDDIDVLPKKKIKEAVYQILNEILQIGRHHRIACIGTNHLPTNFQWTRIILNESHIVVYCPAAATNKVKYMLQTYVDLEPEQIRYFEKCGSRWIAVFKHFPQLCLNEKECGLLNQDSDED